jgi:hypothetical protein
MGVFVAILHAFIFTLLSAVFIGRRCHRRISRVVARFQRALSSRRSGG